MSELIKVFDSKVQSCNKSTDLSVEEIQMVEDVFGNNEYSVLLFKNRKIEKKYLSLMRFKEELIKLRKCKIVSISVVNRDKNQIYKIISEVSRKKGVCAPMLELADAIIYFPQLSYSDIGLLRYLCEKNREMLDYKLLMAYGD